MVLCNYAEMTLTAKIVYYGPGLGGKTTNLNHIHGNTAREARGEMVSLNTDTERTLFFDLLPIAAGPLGGFKAQIQLYTVPGQVFYNAMRKIVLNGADGIVFVADSQRSVKEVNRQSLENLKTNLEEAGLDLEEIPLVFQYNKRDLPEVLTVEEMNELLNPGGRHEWFEASASRGLGVFETLEGISKLTFRAVRERFLGEGRPVEAAAAEAIADAQVAEEAASAKPAKTKPNRKRIVPIKDPVPPPVAEPEPLPVVSSAVQLSLEAPIITPLPPPPELAPEPVTAPPPPPEPPVLAKAEAPPPEPAAPPAEEDWELSFADDAAGRRGRRDMNLMAELEKLRVHVGGSPTSPRPPSVEKKLKLTEPAAALDQLVASTLGKSKPAPEPKRERPALAALPLAFQFDATVPRPAGKPLQRLVFQLRAEGPAREALGPAQEYVVDLESAGDAETLLLTLKVQLKAAPK
jgi:mutual gliding-motility protein MglA